MGFCNIHNYFTWFHEDTIYVASIIIASLSDSLHTGRKWYETKIIKNVTIVTLTFQFKGPLKRKIKTVYWICSLPPWHKYCSIRILVKIYLKWLILANSCSLNNTEYSLHTIITVESGIFLSGYKHLFKIILVILV